MAAGQAVVGRAGRACGRGWPPPGRSRREEHPKVVETAGVRSAARRYIITICPVRRPSLAAAADNVDPSAADRSSTRTRSRTGPGRRARINDIYARV